MAEPSKTGWIAKYGVPSLVLSVAVLIVQQQQQTFDRLQRILESGYQFYSSGRTALQFAGDGNRELSLLKIIGNAFPNVFCDVRQDIYERASKADMPGGQDKDGRKLIDSVEIRTLYEGLDNAVRPRRKEAADSVIGAWGSSLPWASKQSKTCPALNNPQGEEEKPADQPVAASITGAEPAATTSPAAEPAKPDTGTVRTSDSVAAAPTTTTRDTAATSAGAIRGAPSGPASQPVADTSPAPSLTALPKPVRVFFQIPSDSPDGREIAISEGPRSELADYNYQIMRGVERVPLKAFAGSGAEIRYFGPAQAAAAEQLKAYLDSEFQAEGLEFEIREIGGRYKGMPPQNIEVWIPNPPGAQNAILQQRVQAPVQRTQQAPVQSVQQAPAQTPQ